ncbi:MAG: hypothetical protein JJT85_06385 [Chromatiales bacterium]|nr:hypothetical protein [Chromatiales bacterium]
MWSSERSRWLLVVLLAGMLAGCGFQLREARPLPQLFERTYIETPDRFSPFYQRLTVALRNSGAELVDSRAAATAVLRVRQDNTGRRLLTVSVRNVPREFDVFYEVAFSVEANGRMLIGPESLGLSREFTWDETQVLGKQAEEDQLRNALAADLVGLVMRRLAAIDDAVL